MPPSYRFPATHSAEYCLPIANMAVHLLRQVLADPTISSQNRTRIVEVVAPVILMVDSRSAAETGTRPLFNQDDLDDNPDLREWLNQPLPLADGEAASLDLLSIAMIRLLRSFASEFHRRKWSTIAHLKWVAEVYTLIICSALKQGSKSCLSALPKLWEAQANLARHVTIFMNQCAYEYTLAQVTDEPSLSRQSDPNNLLPKRTPLLEAAKNLSHALMTNGTVMFTVIAIHNLLVRAVETIQEGKLGMAMGLSLSMDEESWKIACYGAESKARAEMKRVAAHVQVGRD
jgi:hypothetical protein